MCILVYIYIMKGRKKHKAKKYINLKDHLLKNIPLPSISSQTSWKVVNDSLMVDVEIFHFGQRKNENGWWQFICFSVCVQKKICNTIFAMPIKNYKVKASIHIFLWVENPSITHSTVRLIDRGRTKPRTILTYFELLNFVIFDLKF